MSERRDRKAVVVPLGILAAAVWAYVFYTLALAWSAPAAPDSVVLPEIPEQVNAVTHVWQDDFRDPFGSATRSSTLLQSGRTQQDAAATPDPIRLRLIGVVDGTAMLEQPDGSVVMARRGTEVRGGRVVAVSATTVTIRRQQQLVEITLE